MALASSSPIPIIRIQKGISDHIILDVSGRIYKIERETLLKYPGSIFPAYHYHQRLNENAPVCSVECTPRIFDYIFEYLIHGIKIDVKKVANDLKMSEDHLYNIVSAFKINGIFTSDNQVAQVAQVVQVVQVAQSVQLAQSQPSQPNAQRPIAKPVNIPSNIKTGFIVEISPKNSAQYSYMILYTNDIFTVDKSVAFVGELYFKSIAKREPLKFNFAPDRLTERTNQFAGDVTGSNEFASFKIMVAKDHSSSIEQTTANGFLIFQKHSSSAEFVESTIYKQDLNSTSLMSDLQTIAAIEQVGTAPSFDELDHFDNFDIDRVQPADFLMYDNIGQEDGSGYMIKLHDNHPSIDHMVLYIDNIKTSDPECILIGELHYKSSTRRNPDTFLFSLDLANSDEIVHKFAVNKDASNGYTSFEIYITLNSNSGYMIVQEKSNSDPGFLFFDLAPNNQSQAQSQPRVAQPVIPAMPAQPKFESVSMRSDTVWAQFNDQPAELQFDHMIVYVNDLNNVEQLDTLVAELHYTDESRKPAETFVFEFNEQAQNGKIFQCDNANSKYQQIVFCIENMERGYLLLLTNGDAKLCPVIFA